MTLQTMAIARQWLLYATEEQCLLHGLIDNNKEECFLSGPFREVVSSKFFIGQSKAVLSGKGRCSLE